MPNEPDKMTTKLKEFYLKQPRVKNFLDNYRGNNVNDVAEVITEEQFSDLEKISTIAVLAGGLFTVAGAGLIYAGKKFGVDAALIGGYVSSAFGILELSSALGMLTFCKYHPEIIKKKLFNPLSQKIAKEILEDKINK